MGLLLVYLFGALTVSFTCSVLEAVLLSAPISYITMREQQGSRAATMMKAFKDNIDKPVAAILSLNTFAHTIGAAGVGAQATQLWGEEMFGIVSAVLTILILVLSEIIPKTVGVNYWRSLISPAAYTIRVMIWITYPFVIISKYITGIFSSKTKTGTVSRDEVSAMVDIATEEGVVRKEESVMIKNILRRRIFKEKRPA